MELVQIFRFATYFILGAVIAAIIGMILGLIHPILGIIAYGSIQFITAIYALALCNNN